MNGRINCWTKSRCSLIRVVQHCFLYIKVSRSKSFFKSCGKLVFGILEAAQLLWLTQHIVWPFYHIFNMKMLGIVEPRRHTFAIYKALGVWSFVILIVCVFSSFLVEHFSGVCPISVLI